MAKTVRLKVEKRQKRYKIKAANISTQKPIGLEPHLAHYTDADEDHRRYAVRDNKTNKLVRSYLPVWDEELGALLPDSVIDKLRWKDEVKLTHYTVIRSG